MIKELVKLTGDGGRVACPECGELLDKCLVCENPFVKDQDAWCVVGDVMATAHYHKECLDEKEDEVKAE